MRRAFATIRVVAFNDCYELSNLPRLATLLKKIARPADAVTVSGDFLSPSVLSGLDGDHSMVDVFNAVGVSHVSFGNHEADISMETLDKRIKEFSGRWLNSNVTGFTEKTAKVALVESPCGNARIGLLGLIGDEDGLFRSNTFKGLEIEGVQRTVLDICSTELVDAAVDAVLPLTHQSLHKDIALAESFAASSLQKPPMPLILGGHEHEPMIVEASGPTKIVKAGSECAQVAIVDFTFFESEVDVDIIFEETATYPPDPDVAVLVERHSRLVESLEGEALVDAGAALDSHGPRLGQTSVGALFCTACRRELGADTCIINGASIKGSALYPNGKLTLRQLRAELPFPTKMVVLDLPGKVIEHAVIYSRTNGPEGERRGYLQLDDGVELAHHPDGTLAFKSLMYGKLPFFPEQNYIVALPRNLLAGFCEIEPLMSWARANPTQLPGKDAFVPAFNLVVSHFSKALFADLGMAFEELDLDNSGLIDGAEVMAAIERTTGRTPSEAFVLQLLSSLDENDDGVLDRVEWEAVQRFGQRFGE